MDNDRPSLDLRHFEDVCPDKNGMSKCKFYELGLTQRLCNIEVPVIAVFTKYDQFKRNIKMKLEDQDRDPAEYIIEVENVFHRHYLDSLSGSPLFVCLESEDFVNCLGCTMLISILQECISMANGVLNLLKRLPMHSVVAWFHLCSLLCRRIILS
jgi:hypothetical protein